MSESIMQCSNCGKSFSTRLQHMNENGNPVCDVCHKKQHSKENAERTESKKR